jgi:membrane protein YqaA with SNARE-associated domain
LPEPQPVAKKRGFRWQSYFIIFVLVALFLALPIFGLLYFQEEIKQAQAYGYVGVFVVGLLCGISVIPAPTQILIFTFGHVLPWVWVGLIAGLGAGVGAITVYLTGAGAQSIWSRIKKREHLIQHRLGIQHQDIASLKQARLWSRWQKFYDRMVNWISGKGGSWALFITAALVISPFYPAGLAAGSIGMGLIKFFLITWAGKTVRYLYVAAAGYYGLEFISHLLR